MKALVLGCGLVGGTIALDLSTDFDVTVMDPSEKGLNWIRSRAKNVKTLQESATNPEVLAKAVKDADIVCEALPSFLEKPVYEQLIRLGKNFCTPSGYLVSEGMDDLARKHGVTAVFDMGVAPGMSNFLCARGAHFLDRLEEGKIYVGGLPDKLDPPFNYKTVFCLPDTLGEYVNPARYVKDGKRVEAEALSGIEHIDFPGIGTLEAFFTDGLRSGSENIKGDLVFEKTMRYPGYAEQMKLLRHMGLFREDAIDVKGNSVVPKDVTATLLAPLWELHPEKGEVDLTIMRVIAKGPKEGKTTAYTWDLLDRLDPETKIHSMARTTAFPCTITARAIAKGMIRKKGFIAPELLADNDDFYTYVMAELKSRGIEYTESVKIF